MTIRYFTFGHVHTADFPLPGPGKLCDYYVTVDLPEEHPESHRAVFIKFFTAPFCPSPIQFGFEYYGKNELHEEFYLGELCRITEEGIQ